MDTASAPSAPPDFEALGQAQAGQELFARPEAIVPFLQKRAGSVQDLTREPSAALQRALQWMQFICGAGDPKQAFQPLEGKSGTCGKTWKQGELAYKCVTCQADATCAICVECFNRGDHTGHNYRMVQTGGGMCDCGDASAWSRVGFCRDHQGLREGEDPTEGMEGTAQAALVACCFHLLHLVVQWCHALVALEAGEAPALGVAPNEAEISAAAQRALKWTLEVAQMGDRAKRIIALALALTRVPGPVPLLPRGRDPYTTLLQSCFRLEYDPLPEAVAQGWYSLYLSVLTDHVFKLAFARLYLADYERINSPAEKRRRNGSGGSGERQRALPQLTQFSVQLLTVPTVVQSLLQAQPPGPRPLHVMVDTLKRFTEKHSVKRTLRNTLTWKLAAKLVMEEADFESWVTVIRDLRYCMATSNAVAMQFLKDKQLLDGLLFVMHRIQGSSVLERKDSDDASWQAAAEYERHFAALLFKWHEAAGAACGKAASGAAVPPALTEALQQFVKAIRAFVLEMEMQGPHAQPDPHSPWLVEFSVLTHPFTFFLPLHRFFASALAAACASRPALPLHRLLPDPLPPRSFNANIDQGPPLPPIIALLVEHPLALQVARAQVRNMLWQRNHMHIIHQTEFYESSYFRAYSYALDMFLLQVAAVLLGPSYYVALVAERFKLVYEEPQPGRPPRPPGSSPELKYLRPIGLQPPPPAPLEPEKLTEALLGHLLATALERTKCGATAGQNLRRQLIHHLATGKKSHSELLKAVPKFQTDEEEAEDEGPVNVDELISEIADFFPPATASQQGYFTLKKECWAEVDMHFPLAAPDQVTLMMGQRREALGKAARIHPAPYLPPPPTPNFIPVLAILHCELTHSLVFAALVSATEDSQTTIALDILLLTLQTLDQPGPGPEQAAYLRQQEAEFQEKLRPHAGHLYPVALPGHDLVINIQAPLPTTGRSTLHFLLSLTRSKEGADHQETMEEILELLAKRSPLCRQDIEEFRAAHREGPADTDTTTDQKKERARRRHEEMMKRMQAQQALFESTLDEEELDSLEEVGAEEATGVGLSHLPDMAKLLGGEVCVLCHQQQSPHGATQLSFVCQVTRSSMLKQADAQGRAKDPALPSVALGINHEPLVTALGPDGCLIVSSPVFADVVQDSNVHLLFCGHAMHLDCFDSHHAFMCKSMLGGGDEYSFKGAHLIYVQRGEYLCPLCGRVGNTVCPLVPEPHSALLRDGAAAAGPLEPLPVPRQLHLWQEVVRHVDAAYRPTPAPRPADDGARRLDDALESFVETLYMVLTKSSRGRFYEKCAYRGPQDLFSCAVACVAMHIAALELNARVNNLENGVLYISIRAGGLLRKVLSAVLAYSRRRAFEAADARALVRCFSGDACVVTEEARVANPSLAGEFEVQWPPLLSCDVFAVALQLLFLVVLREEAFGPEHCHAVLCRALQAHVLRTVVALVAPDPTAPLSPDESVPAAFCQVHSRVQDFLLKQLYVNGPVQTHQPRSPTSPPPDGKGTGDAAVSTSGGNLFGTLDAADSTSSLPLAPISTLADLYREVQRAVVGFLRRWALLHYALTGAPLPHLPGQVDDSSTYSTSLAPGPPLMMATPETDEHSLVTLAAYLQLPESRDVVTGACQALLQPECADPSSALLHKWLGQMVSAAACNPVPYCPAATQPPADWPAKKRKQEEPGRGPKKAAPPPGPIGPSPTPTDGAMEVRAILAQRSPYHMEVDDEGLPGGEEDEEEEEEEDSEAGSDLVAVLQTEGATPLDMPPDPPSDDDSDASVTAGDEDLEEFIHKGAYLPLIPSPAGCTYPYHLIGLPGLYQHLAQKYHHVRCKRCPNQAKAPDQPALCLLCGDIVCCSSKCCMRRDLGECVAHSLACGGGVGLFLLTKKTTLLVQRNERFAVLPSLYLDAHGEEDTDLQRGRPLYLSRARYQELLQLVTACAFDHDSRVLAFSRRTRWQSL
eukprot:EG_transcript_130